MRETGLQCENAHRPRATRRHTSQTCAMMQARSDSCSVSRPASCAMQRSEQCCSFHALRPAIVLPLTLQQASVGTPACGAASRLSGTRASSMRRARSQSTPSASPAAPSTAALGTSRAAYTLAARTACQRRGVRHIWDSQRSCHRHLLERDLCPGRPDAPARSTPQRHRRSRRPACARGCTTASALPRCRCRPRPGKRARA